MPVISARINEDLHEQIRIEAALQGMSVSDYTRNALEDAVNRRIQADEESPYADNPAVALLAKQLAEKDKQIERLHQLMAMDKQDKERLAGQLDQIRLQIEETQKRRWWKWWGRERE